MSLTFHANGLITGSKITMPEGSGCKGAVIQRVKVERGGNTAGFHTHMVIEKPEHLSTSKFAKLAEHSWMKTKDGVSLYAEDDVYDRKGLDGYNAKQQSQKNTNAEVDVMNAFTI